MAKIAHLTSVHSATDPRIFKKECRSLAQAGFHVTCVGSHSADTVIDQVQIKSLKEERGRLARMTATVWEVYREAVRLNADVYHFHDPELIPVGLLLRARGKHVIYDLHEDVPKDILAKRYLPAWSRKPLSWIVDKVEQTACRRFSALVTVTPSIAERFRSVNGKIVVVYNYPHARELIRDIPPHSWKSRRSSVAYVGGNMSIHGIREMVKAMSLLSPGVTATLEIAGRHLPGEPSPEELAGLPGWSRVHHHGHQDQRKIFEILHHVRAGLLVYHPVPNAFESLPQKLFEYMGAGLPVIASDFPLWRRILGDAGCGIFVDPMDPRDIARAIEYVMANPAQAEEMGRRGRAAVMERYNWDVQAEKLVKLYTELVSPLCAA